jgi:acyl-CoA dehydrogenase
VVVAAEEMILAGRSVGTTVGLGSHGIALPPILRAGTEAQRAALGAAGAAGRVGRGARDHRARRRERRRRLRPAPARRRRLRDQRRKTFITSGASADLGDRGGAHRRAGHGGMSLLVVEKGTPGLHRGA